MQKVIQVAMPEPGISSGDSPPSTKSVQIVSPAWVRKVGQCPPWRPEIDKDERRALEALGEDTPDTYRNGLSCEGVSYGMGAFAYYRSIVERIVEALWAIKTTGIEGEAREALEQQWREADRDGSARIALVYATLPEELRADGANPLGHLYGRLSNGLHGGKDEDCMNEAEELREELLDLVISLQRDRDRKATAERMRARQERAKKGAT